ncbi:MAG: glycosyltransferase family 4 protein [Opitutaceae bacterium]|nr:glycosyltransferase family 4 protein [Opitutaceae bacterium]
MDVKTIRKKLGLPDFRIILSIGHLGPIKGHDDSIAALSLVKQYFPGAKLYIAGDGTKEDIERLHGKIEKLKLQDSVILLGQITNALEWMQACDIFLQPSLEEAFGLVFLEAGLCRKPSVATKVGGIPEIIVDGEDGYLVEPHEPEKLAERIISIFSSDDKLREMGDSAFHRVEQNFLLSDQIDKLESYFKLISQHKSENS